MGKRAKMSIILSFLLIFLCSIATQEALAQPSMRYDVVVMAFTPPDDPHGEILLNGVRVDVTVEFRYRCSGCSPIWDRATMGQSSGTTSTEEVERVNERGERETVSEEGRFTARGDMNIPEDRRDDELLVHALARGENVRNQFDWGIRVTFECPANHPHERPENRVTVGPSEITGSGTPDDPYVVHGTVRVRCGCQEPPKEVGALIAPGQKGQATVVAHVAVREEEKVQVAQQIGGQVVAQVLVNDKPRKPPKPEEGITVNPWDVIQLVSTTGSILGQFDFVPEGGTVLYPDTTPVIECPAGQPAVVALPGNYTGTSIENIAVTTGPIETAVATGPEKAPAVTAPATAVGGLQPVLKTDDTVIVAGQLDNSAIGSNAINVMDKSTGKVLGQAQIDMWRLAGASLNPPVVKKGQDTNLRLEVFGPPDLQLEVTAPAGEGLTPKQLTATAPISVLQKQGLGAFTATKPGTHNVSVKAVPVTQVVQKQQEAGKNHPGEQATSPEEREVEREVEEAPSVLDELEELEELTPQERDVIEERELEEALRLVEKEELTPEERNLLSRVFERIERKLMAPRREYRLVSSEEASLIRRVLEAGRLTEFYPPLANYYRLLDELIKAHEDFYSARYRGDRRDRAAMERARRKVERLRNSLEYLELSPEARAYLERNATSVLESMDGME